MPSRRRDDEEEEDLEIDDAPTSINPYTILSLDKTATQDQIKSAYRKAALRHHPDKASEADKATAHTKFQEIAFAYAVLSDERRRKRYDLTGRTEETLVDDEDGEFDWLSFYREQYSNVINEEVISNFANEYRGSEEEKTAVLQAYEKRKGDMDKLYEEVMLSNPLEDEERFRKMIEEAIEKGEAEAHKKFTEEPKKKRDARMKKARREAEEAARVAAGEDDEDSQLDGSEDKDDEDMPSTKPAAKAKPKSKPKAKAAKKSTSTHADLAALIQQRQKGRAGDFLADLEAKYAPKGKTKGGAKRPAMDEPPEEAFAATAARKTKKGKKA